ncbi:hypothetical protein GTP45_10625 [Pseudoduganella sp. FT55W]|uniref:Uncharacterized protein n=1 Tax=Duganella rivi TaxID=2666083 RepID=A0A7X4KBH9_9BURK|nr:hypothetical protein [Duganella rivi]MYM67284.1 hypothetical protein [Duganella rivi]
MRYPNLRYGNPTEFAYYVMCYGDDIPAVARLLRRDERTVRDWLSGRQRVPFWVPELMRLRRFETDVYMRQNSHRRAPALGVVTHEAQLEIRRPDVKKPQSVTALRLDDFDQVDRSTLAV